MESLFLPSLEGVAEVMKEQLRLAWGKKMRCEGIKHIIFSSPSSFDPQKIILMGGFGQSESLHAHLRKSLTTECGPSAQNIVFEMSKLP